MGIETGESRHCSRRTTGQLDKGTTRRQATGEKRQATLNVHFGHLNVPQTRQERQRERQRDKERGRTWQDMEDMEELAAGLFITAAYLSSSWMSARSRRAFDVPPASILNSCVCECVYMYVCVSVCVSVANAVNRAAHFASSSLLFCVLMSTLCFWFLWWQSCHFPLSFSLPLSSLIHILRCTCDSAAGHS